jgi:hypothetical protein
MDLIRTLNSVGKSTFVKYYYNFRDKSRDACVLGFDEPYTDNAKNTRTGHAQRIFRENKQKEALELIINSNRVDEATREKAYEILQQEKGKY